MSAVDANPLKRKNEDQEENDDHESKKLKLTDSNEDGVETKPPQAEVVQTPVATAAPTTTVPTVPTAPVSPPPNYAKMTAKQLKQECRKKGLKVGGNKTELIARLTVGETPKASKVKGSRTNAKGVETRLNQLGIDKVKNVSNCLKKAIQLGYVNVSGDNGLDTVVLADKCESCSEPLSATVKDLLYQPDYAGLDYEEGGEDAPVKCEKCGTGNYVTQICSGNPQFDSGKFHNHCTQCPGYGKCIGDYRESHCEKCGKHYFAGLSGFDCSCESRGRGGGYGSDSDEDGEDGCCIM